MKYLCICLDCGEELETDYEEIKEAWEKVHNNKKHVVCIMRKKDENASSTLQVD